MTQEDRNRAERKLLAAARAAARQLPAGLPPVLYLTDPARTPDPVATASRLPTGWGVVYRHFGHRHAQVVAERLRSACRQRHLKLLIANDPALALAVGADGVHWPFAERSKARRWQGRFALSTVSAHSPVQLRLLQDAGFDAVLLSTAFPSESPSARTPLGATRFRGLARRARVPVYALGGLGADTAGRIAPVAAIAGIEGIESVFGPRT